MFVHFLLSHAGWVSRDKMKCGDFLNGQGVLCVCVSMCVCVCVCVCVVYTGFYTGLHRFKIKYWLTDVSRHNT